MKMKTIETKTTIFEFNDLIVMSMIIGNMQEIYCRQPHQNDYVFCFAVCIDKFQYDGDAINELRTNGYLFKYLGIGV